MNGKGYELLKSFQRFNALIGYRSVFPSMSFHQPQVQAKPIQIQNNCGRLLGCSNPLELHRRTQSLWYPSNWAARCSAFTGLKMDVEGSASDGRTYGNIKEMWAEEIGGGAVDTQENPTNKRKEWYNKGVGYWERVEASVDGVLGGYGHVNGRDVQDSSAFLVEILNERLMENGHLVALDCGAGVGRVTKNLLLKHFREVDLVEPVSHFLDTAREKLKAGNQSKSERHSAVNFYCTPLQEFTPEAGRYDVIWVQWCIGHLTDDDFVSFFNRAKTGLKPGGFFVLKENVARNGFVLDKDDSSVTRSDAYFRELFKQAGLYLYKTKAQKGFPQELFPVKMYALTTEAPAVARQTRSKRQINKPSIIR